MSRILVSACLLGCNCRYDGQLKTCQKVIDLAEDPDNVLIPICPEQMGGLTTPRVSSERQRDGNGNILPPTAERALVMKNGSDVTENYNRGVEIALKIAKLNKIDYAILKSGSPSCGKGMIYDGSFSGSKAPGNGITTDALLAAGYKVINEDEL